MMVFAPVALICLMAEPTQCRAVVGNVEPTELSCMESLSSAVYFAESRPDIYVAGLACVETEFLDESASLE
jgi:hypothetical protein